MDKQRWIEIEFNNAPLTEEELAQGWHYCPNWDEMCVGPGMPEMDACLCGISELVKLDMI